MNVGLYSKSIVTILAAGLAILVVAMSDDKVTALEIVQVAIAIVTAIGVYALPNLPEGARKYTKFGIAFLGAVLTALTVFLAPGLGFENLGTDDWLNVLLAGLGAVGVYVVPNATAPELGEVSYVVSEGAVIAPSNDPTSTDGAGGVFEPTHY